MLNQVEITSAIQNIFDLWTSIEDQESTFDRLPVISDSYRDCDLHWEADFIQWMYKKERRPREFFIPSTGAGWIFGYYRPRCFTSSYNQSNMPSVFKSAKIGLFGVTIPMCYWNTIAAFLSLAEEQRQQVLDTDCLAD